MGAEVVTFGVSLTAGVLMLVIALLLCVTKVLRKLKHSEYFVLPLVFAGWSSLLTAQIAGYSLAGLVNQLMTWVSQLLGSFAPALATVAFIALAVWVLFKAVDAMWHADISASNVRYVLAVPITLGMIPGFIGHVAVVVLSIPVTVLKFIFSFLFGV